MYLLWCILENTVQSCAVDLTSSSPLCCSMPLLYAILGYIVLLYALLPLLFPAALLSFIRSSRQRNASVGFPPNSAALCVRTNVCAFLTSSNTATLSSCLSPQYFPSLFATHGNALLSSPVLLTFTWSPLFQLLWESRCCSACSSWISANVALPARVLHLSSVALSVSS